ncbi:hypothetical protein J2X36_002563 [Methylobacterium sp. BE186]|uniref:hypothetical protein n=1 Tax=Methylobacterium sp. BE186 TaxID=2817715 RepID=UPI002862806F|nr:hypothetical protein [Methylobacterium sp. BE186]MDR7037812.1 hypothetical protein [Methylobacterium sp. BE186]
MNQIQHSPSLAADDPEDAPVPHVTHDPDTGLPWPDPTVPEPEFVSLARFLFEAAADATDGCLVEPDGICRHGHPSWLLRLGVI